MMRLKHKYSKKRMSITDDDPIWHEIYPLIPRKNFKVVVYDPISKRVFFGGSLKEEINVRLPFIKSNTENEYKLIGLKTIIKKTPYVFIPAYGDFKNMVRWKVKNIVFLICQIIGIGNNISAKKLQLWWKLHLEEKQRQYNQFKNSPYNYTMGFSQHNEWGLDPNVIPDNYIFIKPV